MKERMENKIKIQIKSVYGSVLFEYEKENNSIKDTLEEAVKNGAYLRGADLGGAKLRGADLGGDYLAMVEFVKIKFSEQVSTFVDFIATHNGMFLKMLNS